MRNATRFTAFLNTALLLTGIGTAQTTAPRVLSAPNLQSKTAPTEAGQPSAVPTENEAPHTAPVFWITSVEVLRSTHTPNLDVVRVRGLATTEGWESAELVPLTKGTPADGILDLALVAEAPENSTTPTSFPEIEAVFAIEPGHPFKGVRVHGAANRVVLKALPGYAEAPTHPKDCASCTGKYLVRTGESVPAGRTPETVVHEEDMPRNLRVIRESDGLGSLESDPNRMTLLLNEKGEIILAIWD